MPYKGKVVKKPLNKDWYEGRNARSVYEVEHVLEIERLKAKIKSAYMHGFDAGMSQDVTWTDRHEEYHKWLAEADD